MQQQFRLITRCVVPPITRWLFHGLQQARPVFDIRCRHHRAGLWSGWRKLESPHAQAPAPRPTGSFHKLSRTQKRDRNRRLLSICSIIVCWVSRQASGLRSDCGKINHPCRTRRFQRGTQSGSNHPRLGKSRLRIKVRRYEHKNGFRSVERRRQA